MFYPGRTVFSLEVFPPKKGGDIEALPRTLAGLAELKPDFISVTYGAGGNAADLATAEICAYIKKELGIEALAHLTCINNTKAEVAAILAQLNARSIENVLALRGDINPQIEPKRDFANATELTAFIRDHSELSISGGCYPEGHNEAPDLATDIKHLKEKVEAGAGHLISQLFFDNRLFYDFIDLARAEGIMAPIEAGIMPVTNFNQINRLISMCGASLPRVLGRILQRYEHDPDGLRAAGIDYAAAQIEDLISHRVDGIHLYAMNNPAIARSICQLVPDLGGCLFTPSF